MINSYYLENIKCGKEPGVANVDKLETYAYSTSKECDDIFKYINKITGLMKRLGLCQK